ncbi:uncharacterized protein LOC116248232 [Nymphaea colorata]|nr:uncharacterized protein LOC116248232 [Nymphaea colorata]
MSFPGEERMVTERIRKKLDELNVAVQNQLSGVQDHVNFTLQQAYFKCAHECFDRRKRQEQINNCVENCSVPVFKANGLVESEMANFQERLSRSMMVCQDHFEASKLQGHKNGDFSGLESCVDKAIEDNISFLPHIVDKLSSALSIDK